MGAQVIFGALEKMKHEGLPYALSLAQTLFYKDVDLEPKRIVNQQGVAASAKCVKHSRTLARAGKHPGLCCVHTEYVAYFAIPRLNTEYIDTL